MFPGGGMMDPEMMRLAQEQMSRMSPADLARIQQQMMSNPELLKMASESMKNMNAADLRRAAEQLKYTQPDEMAEIGAKMANATPEELASMRSRADAQINYQLNAAQMLKQKGNELHSQGIYSEASEKYLRAKNNLKGIPSSKAGTLLLACSLNLMSCYLKTNQFDECIQEGTEVLATDAKNVKALYRRGQAYKSLGQLKSAVSDLTKALEFSPDDETIADVLRDAKEKLIELGGEDEHTGLKIEDITDEVHETSPSESSAQRTEETSKHMNGQSENTSGTSVLPTNTEYLHALKDEESIRSFQNFMSQANPETLASAGGGKLEGISPDMVKTASSLISSMPPDELQRMLEMATSFQENNNPLSNSHQGSGMPNFTPDMLKTATDMMNKIPPEELQNMLNMASSLGGQGSTSTNSVLQSNGSRINKDSNAQGKREKSRIHEDIGESSTSRGVSDLRNAPQPSFPGSSLDMQEQIKNQMNNPAMREMMSTMMKNMSPDMMANMSEQFGFKLSREDAESINADEAVAYGAAVLAANLGGIGNEVVRDLILLDVTPLSLGIWKTVDDLSEDDMSVLIPKHTPIPTVKERIYLTNVDNQVTMPIKVYQGESGKTKENILLDSFKLHGIPAAPKHEQKVKVRLNIDANGILEVSAEVISTGKKSTKTTVEPMHVFCDGEQ